MKKLPILFSAMLLIFCIAATAQTNDTQPDVASSSKTDTTKKVRRKAISIGSDGIKISTVADSATVASAKHEEDRFDIHFGMLDLGFIGISDNTDYTSAETQSFLQKVTPNGRNQNLFSLRGGKTINVNIYPVVAKYRLFKTERQRLYVSLAAGLQIYNLRYTKPITYINETEPLIFRDSISFSKNKVGISYLTIPLMFTAKTKLSKKLDLVYGAGITGGYRIASWTKQKSNERGTKKNHDPFNFADFNSCVTGEIGLEGILRLYASYQLTALNKSGIEQYPFCIGVRFLGI